MIYLRVMEGPAKGSKFELGGAGPHLIGRSSESLQIKDHTLSRRHAEIFMEEDRWFIRDLGSVNRTFVNEKRIDSEAGGIPLSHGDTIQCGSTIMHFFDTATRLIGPVKLLGADEMDVIVRKKIDTGAFLLDGDSLQARERDQAAAALRHLQIIYELSAHTAAHLDRDELLEHVLDLVFEEFDPDRGFILLQENPDGPPKPAVVRYKNPDEKPEEGTVQVSQSIIEHTLRRGRGILSSNAMHDERFADSTVVQNIRSVICVPIWAEGKILGIIHIDSAAAGKVFTEMHLNLLTAIGHHAGLALTAAELLSSHVRNERLAAMGETMGSVSHAIKNIFQGLQGSIDLHELALTKGDLVAARNSWALFTKGMGRVSAVVRDMLTFAKGPIVTKTLTALKPLIEEVVSIACAQCEAQGIAVKVSCAGDLPPVPVNPNTFHQALMNLVTNAVEAVSPKTGRIEVTARFLPATLTAEVSVSDNGPGIHPSRHEEIFEIFRSGKGGKGAGLGLAVTRKIIKEHGGTLRVESEPGKGAKFVIELPIDTPEIDPSKTYKSDSIEPAALHGPRPKKPEAR